MSGHLIVVIIFSGINVEFKINAQLWQHNTKLKVFVKPEKINLFVK